MVPVISINGQIQDATTHMGISPFDRGFMLGDGIFETMRVTQRTPWYLARHLRRLQAGAQVMGINYPAPIPTWISETVQRASEGNGSEEMALRVTLTRGIALTPGLTAVSSEQPTTVIMAYDPPPIPNTVYERGMSAMIASATRNERSRAVRIKTTNYAESIIALQEARSAEHDEAIFLDTHNFVSEATSSNVFVGLNGVLVTPATTHGILLGITRAVVLELATRLNIPTAEREVERDELINADEVFVTSSLRGIAPIVSIGHEKLGNGIPGPLTRRLMAAYNAITDRT